MAENNSRKELKTYTVDDLVSELESRGYEVKIAKLEDAITLPDGWEECMCGNCEHCSGHFCYEYDGMVNDEEAEDCSHFLTFSGKRFGDDDLFAVVVIHSEEKHILYFKTTSGNSR